MELCRLQQQRNPGTCWRHRCSRCLCHNPGQALWTFSGVVHRSSHPKLGPPSPLCGRYRDGLVPPRHMEAGRFLCGIHGNSGRSLYGRGTFRGSWNKVSHRASPLTRVTYGRFEITTGDDRDCCDVLDATEACVATEPLLVKRKFLRGSLSTGSRSTKVYRSMAVDACRDRARSLARSLGTECE